MKILYCTACGDMRSMNREGAPTSCSCGNVTAWWTDPARGAAKVYVYYEKDHAWMIGLHNHYLGAATSHEMRRPEWAAWRALHQEVTTNSEGYIFSGDKRNCWAAPFQPGWTSDVSWAEWVEVVERAVEFGWSEIHEMLRPVEVPGRRITINRNSFVVDKSFLTGVELRDLPTPPIRDTDDLFLETDGDPHLVDKFHTLPMADGIKLFTVPRNINAG